MNDAARVEVDDLTWGSLRDWMQLVRLPAMFTLLSNCLAAAVVAGSHLQPVTALLPVLLASLLTYWAGMILNDVVDIEEDREHRPTRPLPAGRISPVIAGHVGTGMLLIAPIIVLGTLTFHQSVQLWVGAAFASSVALSLCVRCYNSVLKKTPLGPILMGGCRALNILVVGLTLLAVLQTEEETYWPVALFAYAASIGLYILGVTIYASQEETESSGPVLAIGLFFEVVGIILLCFLPKWTQSDHAWTLDPNRGFPLLMCLIGLTVINRGVSGILHPIPRKVQLSVRHALLTLILIDAGVVLMWLGPWYALAVIVLLAPALASALRFRTT